jgi:hypothetical protein
MRAAEANPWWDGPCEVARGVRRLELGGRAALFCERSQQLFELNPTADLIWQGLAAGRSPRAVAREVQGLGAAPCDAEAFVRSSAEAWLREGRLLPAAVAARVRGPPDRELSLRVGDLACTLGLFLALDDPQAKDLAAVFGQFAGAEPSDHGLHISVVAHADGYILLVDGAPRGFFGPEQIVPQVKAALTEQLARSTRDGAFLLHAALLAWGGGGLLISGPPGAGKTTLALALAARGFGYGSDDIVAVSRQGALTGIRFSPAAKAGSWDLLALPGDLPTHVRADGQAVRYVPVAGFAPGEVHAVAWALRLDRRPGASAALEPIAPLEMLTDLLSAAFSAEHALCADALEAFAARLADALCHRLVYDDLGEAAAVVEAMVGG